MGGHITAVLEILPNEPSPRVNNATRRKKIVRNLQPPRFLTGLMCLQLVAPVNVTRKRKEVIEDLGFLDACAMQQPIPYMHSVCGGIGFGGPVTWCLWRVNNALDYVTFSKFDSNRTTTTQI